MKQTLYTKFISFSIFIFFCFVSFAMFSSMLRTYERQVRVPHTINQIIITSKDGVITAGGKILYEGFYTKTEDCAGTWSVRLQDSEGKLYILASGPIGTNRIGTYKIQMDLYIPVTASEGNAVIMEDDSLVCTDSFVFVARSQTDGFYIQRQEGKESKESTIRH